MKESKAICALSLGYNFGCWVFGPFWVLPKDLSFNSSKIENLRQNSKLIQNRRPKRFEFGTFLYVMHTKKLTKVIVFPLVIIIAYKNILIEFITILYDHARSYCYVTYEPKCTNWYQKFERTISRMLFHMTPRWILQKMLDFSKEQKLLRILGDRPWCFLSASEISERSLVVALYTTDQHFGSGT